MCMPVPELCISEEPGIAFLEALIITILKYYLILFWVGDSEVVEASIFVWFIDTIRCTFNVDVTGDISIDSDCSIFGNVFLVR